MARILCTHPGRHGDVIWSLPTIRAISRYFAQPVDFCTSWAYRKVCEVINGQDYIGHAWGDRAWEIVESAPISPAAPPSTAAGYDQVFNLGLTEWPELPIAEWTAKRALERYPQLPGGILAPSLQEQMAEPWISVASDQPGITVVALGWSEEWIELKMGISFALFQRFAPPRWPVNFHLAFYQDARHNAWKTLFPPHVGYHATDSWWLRAQILAESKVLVGCLGGMWVLANAMGKPAVICEPNEHRWNTAFWREAPQNRLVRGTDGKPTFDVRHVGDELEVMLRRVGVEEA